jgi:ABC-type branched-subunit amino acid transport system ATPase component
MTQEQSRHIYNIAMLEVTNLEAGYGKKQILFGLDLQVHPSEIVAIIGANGSGKSTILKAISGITPIWNGEICLNGKSLNNLSCDRINNKLAFVPQSNSVFDQLTVLENLAIGGHSVTSAQLKQRIEVMLEIFPTLKAQLHKEARKLSGGQQQMLGIARALVPTPQILLLDEPSLGLSPQILSTVFEQMVHINQEFGVAILVVEQRVREVLGICNRVYAVKQGKISFEGNPVELLDNPPQLKNLFL